MENFSLFNHLFSSFFTDFNDVWGGGEFMAQDRGLFFIERIVKLRIGLPETNIFKYNDTFQVISCIKNNEVICFHSNQPDNDYDFFYCSLCYNYVAN